MKIAVIRLNMFEHISSDAMKPILFGILKSLTPERFDIDFYDERMTTMVAYRYLDGSGTYGKARKNAVDTLSAEIILQGYIDRERALKK